MTIDVVKAIRRMSNLDQAAFAEKIGISSSLLSKLEVGQLSLSKRTISKIMHTFRLSEQDIIDLAEMIEHLKK